MTEWNNSEYPYTIPELATLTIGRNDAGFFSVVDGCIFHGNLGRDYGPDYPVPDGDCFKTINNARETIDDDKKFARKLANSFTSIIEHATWKDTKFFKVFVTGHAFFFNQEDPACDNYNFRAIGGPRHEPNLPQRRK